MSKFFFRLNQYSNLFSIIPNMLLFGIYVAPPFKKGNSKISARRKGLKNTAVNIISRKLEKMALIARSQVRGTQCDQVIFF